MRRDVSELGRRLARPLAGGGTMVYAGGQSHPGAAHGPAHHPRQLAILQMVAKHPGVDREQLARLAQASDEDMKYLLEHDLVREREAGKYRVAHFGEMVLRRS